MSFKRLSIVTVFLLVALLLLFLPSPVSSPKNILTVGQVLAAATQNTTKSVIALTIQDKQVDLSNPDAPININLPGDPTKADTFYITVIITYNDGSTDPLAFTFNYQPPSSVTPPPSLSPETCDYEEDASSCPNGGLQTCTGTKQDGVCKYDSAVDPNCRDIRCNEPSGESQPPPPPPPEPEPPPPPEPSCGDFEYKYWECDWDNQQTYDVYQDSCGNYDRRDYHVVEGLCGAPE